MKKVALTTLGCDKNTCDSECLAGALKAQGYTFVADDADADIIIVNTCAFIKSARDEALRVIKSKLEFKDHARIVVTGCMTVKHKNLIPDGVEVWDIAKIPLLEEVDAKADSVVSPNQKLLSTPQSYAYIKISDGCDNRCSYCTIPSIRGSYKARPESEILDEVTRFASLGVGEFILVAQDLTKYPNLVKLIQNISKINGVQRIRLHYVYPNGITQELLDEIARNPKVCKYLDIPFQHVSPRIVSLMNRKGGAAEYLELIANVRKKIPGITIRSTFMVGFPTETDDDFAIACDFLETANLDYVGFFKYSREQGTPAYSMEQVPEKIKSARLKTIQAIQSKVLEAKHNGLVGQRIKVVCDFYDAVLGCSITRCEHLSPEVDPIIIVKARLKVGEYAEIKITGVQKENLVGELA